MVFWWVVVLEQVGGYFSLITTASSSSSVEYIHRLESEIIELEEARARDQEAQAKKKGPKEYFELFEEQGL